MNFVARRLNRALTTAPRYGLLPNSDYSCRQKVDPVLFLELNSAKRGRLGDLHIKLFEGIVPKTVENFKRLFLGNASYNNQSLSLLGTAFHQVYTNAFAASGKLPGGPMSIYGPKFKDESFEVLHTKPGLLSSVSNGNTNSSEWILTLGPCAYFDHRHVVFGEVVDGLHLLRYIESIGSKTGHVRDEIKIVASGLLDSHSKHHCHHGHVDASHSAPALEHGSKHGGH